MYNKITESAVDGSLVLVAQPLKKEAAGTVAAIAAILAACIRLRYSRRVMKVRGPESGVRRGLELHQRNSRPRTLDSGLKKLLGTQGA